MNNILKGNVDGMSRDLLLVKYRVGFTMVPLNLFTVMDDEDVHILFHNFKYYEKLAEVPGVVCEIKKIEFF